MSSSSVARAHHAPRQWFRVARIAVVALVLAGCSAIVEASPEPTPMPFPGIAGELAKRGLALDAITSGDDGCGDSKLTPTAIGFDASGLGVEKPVRLRIFIFRTGDTYDRRRPDVDACAAVLASDPATFELIDARPFVLVGQGPWPEAFRTAIREALAVSAGNGG